MYYQWVLGFLVHVLPVGARVLSTCPNIQACVLSSTLDLLVQVSNSCMEVVVGAVLVHRGCRLCGNLVLVNHGRLEGQRTRKECGQCGCWTNQQKHLG